MSEKAFCGYCGSRLVGESGKSKTGAMYHYYACGKKKKYHNCNKKNEKKDFLEWYVVEQTIKYVLLPERIDYIAERIIAKYDQEFNDKRIKARYFDKIETLETQKADIEFNLASLKIANGHRYTKEQIME